MVEFELHGGPTSSIVVSEIDIPFCDDDIEKAKGYLSLILNARRGDHSRALLTDLFLISDILTSQPKPKQVLTS